MEDRRLDGLPVPDRTGTLIQMNQAASDERGTEENSVVSPILRFSYRLSIVIGLVTAFSQGGAKKKENRSPPRADALRVTTACLLSPQSPVLTRTRPTKDNI